MGVGVGGGEVGEGAGEVGVAVAVGGLKPGGAGTSATPTTRIRSPDLLSATAAYVNNGLSASLDSTVAYPLFLERLPNPITP